MSLLPSNEFPDNRRTAAKLMKRLIMSFRAALDEELRPYGITTAQLQLLKAIHAAPGSSGAQISRMCEVTPQTAQVMLQRAEESGWVVRGKDDVNDRIVTASLTSQGEELLTMVEQRLQKIEARLWRDIPTEKIDLFIEVLEHCLGNLTQE